MFVGTPSTGLMVKPIIMDTVEVSINESSDVKTPTNTFEYIKESENMDNKSSLSDIKMLFKESIQSIKETKSKIDRSTSFSLVETELAKVKIIECDTKFGARDLINVIKEWVELKEEIEEDQNPTDEGSNAEQDIAESKEDKEKSEKEMCEAKEAKEKAEKEMCEAKEELEESKKELVNESKKTKLIADKLIDSRKQLEIIKTYYNDIKNTAQKTKKQLIDESLRTVGLRSLNDTRSRELRESAESSNKKIKTLINQNILLMNESKQLIKIGAAYKLSAEQLAQKVIDFTENKS